MHYENCWPVNSFMNLPRAVPVLLIASVVFGLPGLSTSANDAQAVEEDRSASELNISIAVFDPGVPTDLSSHRRLQVFPRIREVEALFLPFVLRETLVDTNEWGAVRVVPEPDIAAELLLSGAIVRSDGETLELQVRVIDATGRVWFNKSYTGLAAGGDRQSNSTSATADYQRLYDEIAQDLRAARSTWMKRRWRISSMCPCCATQISLHQRRSAST